MFKSRIRIPSPAPKKSKRTRTSNTSPTFEDHCIVNKSKKPSLIFLSLKDGLQNISTIPVTFMSKIFYWYEVNKKYKNMLLIDKFIEPQIFKECDHLILDFVYYNEHLLLLCKILEYF